jgi:hypothetical protein
MNGIMAMPLSDNKLDEMVASLRIAPSHGQQTIDDKIENNVWLRVGEMTQNRLSRQKSLLAGAVFLVALGAGFGTAEQPATSGTPADNLIGGVDYSPANLLNVS